MVEHVEDLTPGGHDHAGQQLLLLQVKCLLGHRGQHSLVTQKNKTLIKSFVMHWRILICPCLFIC